MKTDIYFYKFISSTLKTKKFSTGDVNEFIYHEYIRNSRNKSIFWYELLKFIKSQIK